MPVGYFDLATADMSLETILPFLFFISLSLVSPPVVLIFVPRKTDILRRLPLVDESDTVDFLACFVIGFCAFFFLDFITFIR
jgi:hypothetical protein